MYKIYFSYKQTWENLDILTSRLKKIKNIFNELGIDSFIWLLDTKKKRENVRNIIDEIYQQIQETDGIVCYIDNKEKSEGMFLELGMWYSLGKYIVVFIKKWLEESFWSIKWLSNKIILFEDWQDFINKLIYFAWIEYSRHLIDNIDKQLVELIKKRQDVVKLVGKAKKILNIQVVQLERWKKLLEEKKQIAKSIWIDSSLIEKIWNTIHEYSVKYQENLK